MCCRKQRNGIVIKRENEKIKRGKSAVTRNYNLPQYIYVTIQHDAEYELQWQVDVEAYDEEVVTGYQCSGCGEVQ